MSPGLTGGLRPASSHGLEGSRAWLALLPVSAILIAFVLFFTGLRLVRADLVFYYTEGPVLGSLAALQDQGDVAALYPADGWQEPPTVLTLYPPVYFLLSSAVDSLSGTRGSLFGLRMVSLMALLGVLFLLAVFVRERRVPVPWFVALLAATLVTPGVYTVTGAAQADFTALLWTWIGITAIRERDDGVSLSVAGVAFLLAFFTKQSFVAAPAALAVCLLIERRVPSAVLLSSSLAVAGLAGILLLDLATAGGYTANTVDALTGGMSWANLTSTLRATEPVQWLPLALVVLVSVRGRARPGFPELYLAAAAVLHTAAMLKTGSSVNYLLEPMFALLLLAVWRYPSPTAEPARRPRSFRLAPATVVLLALAVTLPAVRAAWQQLGTVRAWAAPSEPARVAEFEGHPLTDPFFFPAVLEHGRPWLNDPFAFGALEETGVWDPSGLVADLETGAVPFALTMVEPAPAPAPLGVGTRELVMAYFWRSPPVWAALNANYRVVGSGPLFMWVPRESDR